MVRSIRSIRSIGAALFVSLTVAGCGETATPLPGPLDLTVIPVPDLAPKVGCDRDSDCAAPTPRCDLNTRACVACLPQSDNCPRGERCIASGGRFVCSANCTVDEDCARPDGGAPLSCCSGACVDTSSDTQSCGRCGAVCLSLPHATAACQAGHCGIGACEAGFFDCDHGASNGCEVDSLTDAANCGACGNACVLANAGAACKAGACVVARCNPGFDDCNQSPNDGCEIDLGKDAAHCGSCATACALANATPACRAGQCAIAACAPGFADCDVVPGNGCEVSILTDARNCGSCAAKCSGANSVQACQAGACQIAMCSADYADCDQKAITGCEVNIANDLLNCGGCGRTCAAPANGTAGCANGGCVVAQCKFGFADCNKDFKDGCEADLLSPMNCGNCGKVCAPLPNAAPACVGGVCGLGACDNLFGDCDGNPANGCEKDLAADAANCGKCGAACSPANAKGACLAGQCGVLSCNAGFGDCDLKAANGCETSVVADPLNCGGCGIKCGVNAPNCVNSQCVAALFATINILQANGGGNRDVVFLYAPAGTSFANDAAYAAYCAKYGFPQNQNSNANAVYSQANMFSNAAYYCTSYCCYLGSGNSKYRYFQNFKNSGLPLNTPLQVLDRGCGWYGGSFSLGMNTTDTLVVSGVNAYTYTPDALGPANYTVAKMVTFAQNGVVVCQTN